MSRTRVPAVARAPSPYEGFIQENESGIISFDIPPDATPKELSLVPDIVRLDHRAKHQLGVKTKMWTEVHYLLLNTIVCFHRRDIKGTEHLLRIAVETYGRHNQSRNRMWYLAGTFAGVFVAALLGSLLFFVSGVVTAVGAQLLLLIVLFAGLGSVASVFIRLYSIDLSQDTSRFLVFMSGGSKPLIATIFAVVVFFILKLKIIAISIGASADENSLYAVTSFLCGFSERFATDIISRANVVRPSG